MNVENTLDLNLLSRVCLSLIYTTILYPSLSLVSIHLGLDKEE